MGRKNDGSSIKDNLAPVLAFIKDNSGIVVPIIAIIAAAIGFIKWSDLAIRATAFGIPIDEIPTDFTVYDVVLQIGVAALMTISNAYIYQIMRRFRTPGKERPNANTILVPLVTIFGIFFLLTFFLPKLTDASSSYWENLLSLLPVMSGLFLLTIATLFFPGLFVGVIFLFVPDLFEKGIIEGLKETPAIIPASASSAAIIVVILIVVYGFTCINNVKSTVELDGQNYVIVFSGNSSYCVEKLNPAKNGERIADRIDKSSFKWISKNGIVVTRLN